MLAHPNLAPQRSSHIAGPGGSGITRGLRLWGPPILNPTHPRKNQKYHNHGCPYDQAVGNAPELSGWDEHAAPEFAWTAGDLWQSEVVLGPGSYEFKTIAYNTATQTSRWEIGSNRRLEVRLSGGQGLGDSKWFL